MSWLTPKEPPVPPKLELSDFDFSALWVEPEEGGLIKFVPIISVILEVIILVLLLVKH